MIEINVCFFELIRVAIGNQHYLSRLPSQKEWRALYDMAKKQSLVGVCFAGLQRLGADMDEGFAKIGMSEMLYLKWMGMAAKIQQKNEVVNRQCVALQKRLSADGLHSCILKGQGVGLQYVEHLRGLRQSGDIDIWIEGDRDKALEYFKWQGLKVSYTSIKHAQVDVFEDTEVEVHSRPSWFYSPIHDRRWMKWVKEQEKKCFANKVYFSINDNISLCMPTTEFNVVFLLIHIYRHLFEEGIGLRQLMDYYFVLKNTNLHDFLRFSRCSDASGVPTNYSLIFKQLGLARFAGAVMFVMKEVFDLSEQLMICEPNEKDGRFLLEEIMRGGNFGKYDERNGERNVNRIARGLATMKRNMRYLNSYPSEILWAPVWKMWHWCWRKKHGYI